jgi:hypothetical protein
MTENDLPELGRFREPQFLLEDPCPVEILGRVLEGMTAAADVLPDTGVSNQAERIVDRLCRMTLPSTLTLA